MIGRAPPAMNAPSDAISLYGVRGDAWNAPGFDAPLAR